MSRKRKLIVSAVLVVVWTYLFLTSHGFLRFMAFVALAFSLSVPVLDYLLGKSIERNSASLPKTDAPGEPEKK